MKKGDKVKFNFHGFGEVSTESAIVDNVGDNAIQIEAEDARSMFKFCTRTGKCLNDQKFMGCYRTLHSDYLVK